MFAQNNPIQHSPVHNSPENYENERKTVRYKTVLKQTKVIIVFENRQAVNCFGVLVAAKLSLCTVLFLTNEKQSDTKQF